MATTRRPQSATEAAYQRALGVVDVLVANAGRDVRERLAGVPPLLRARHLARPWRGAAGRKSATLAAAERKAGLVARARELQAAGLTQAQIGREIGRRPRMVRYLLNGR